MKSNVETDDKEDWRKAELGDMHLLLSEKYREYRDLVERCFLNPQSISKGERRVFYLEPQSQFLMEPRVQNQKRHEFVNQVSQLPLCQPLTLMADEMQRTYLEHIRDQSDPDILRQELVKHFKRRQHKLQHKRYKLMLRWAHLCLTSDRVDQVSLAFNSKYTKIQFEMENCVKRVQRLDGQDHFKETKRPSPAVDLGFRQEENHDPISVLRLDDIDVYLRQITYEEKISRTAERFIQKAKWLPLSHRFELYKKSVFYFQQLRTKEYDKHDAFIKEINAYGEKLALERKMLQQGEMEVNQIINALHLSKIKQKQKTTRDNIIASAKYNYVLPPMIFWNEIELKLELSKIAVEFGQQGNLEIDKGHSFQYSISVFFPTEFVKQTHLMQFVPYDVVQKVPSESSEAQKLLKTNKSGFEKTQEKAARDLTQKEKREKELEDRVEKSIFGELNNGQDDKYPVIRVKKSIDWIELVAFKPDLDNDQKYQASLLSCEKNTIDKVLEGIMSMVDVQDASTLTVMLETLAKMHSEKVRNGQCVIDFQNKESVVDLTFFSEDEKTLLDLYQSSLKTKKEFDYKAKVTERSELSFMDIPQHLVSAMNMLLCLRLRKSKIRLLHQLNAFRSIQRRLTLDVREMGTRDRVLGDVRYMKRKGPDEGRTTYYEPDEEKQREELYKDLDIEHGQLPKLSINDLVKVTCDESIDITKDSLVDINKYRFDGRFENHYHSTCPIIPVFHQTFGQPVDRQEISAHYELTHDKDVRRDETQKLVGRADKIYKHKETGLALVMDDFDVNIIYDASFKDLKTLQNEVLKICSFYINKLEPMLDRGDFTNIYPGVDRMRILDEALQLEVKYQEEKLNLLLTYLECYEHVSDILCQQRMVQIMVDEMARRPRLNLQSTHFKDSIETEIALLQERNEFMQELLRMLMKHEFQENTMIREYIEKTYRLLHEQMENKWNYIRPEKKEMELNKRQQIQTGVAGTRDGSRDQKLDEVGNIIERTSNEINQMKEKIEAQTSSIFQKKYADPKEFANVLGMPYSSLQMLMKEHHERDPLVRTSIHEHVSFIKIQEGYPQFLYKTNVLQNLIKFNQDSETIGLLDFYESFHVVPRVISAMQLAFTELNEVHRPDNGLMTSALELFVIKELKSQFRLSLDNNGAKDSRPRGIEYIEDDNILGNSDKMLFYSKEIQASVEDEEAAHNPFVISKLDLKSIEAFNFDKFQGYIDIITSPNDQETDEEYAARRAKVNQQSFSRFYPMLKEHSKLVKFPSLLITSCNSIEVMRLRNLLISTLEQAHILKKAYRNQILLLRKDFSPNFREPFKFGLDGARPIDKQVNFVEEGPARGLKVDLAINEFDNLLASSLNFMDPECFKANILPLGLEELRCVVQYEIVNLQALIVGVRTNQALLDNAQRQLCEVEFFQNNFFVPNAVFNLHGKLSGSNLLETNFRKLPQQFNMEINSGIVSKISPLTYSILAKKMVSKLEIEKQYAQFRDSIGRNRQEFKSVKYEVEQRICRSFRIYLCFLYSQDLQVRYCHDSIKLQCMVEVDRLRKRSHILPRDATFFVSGSPTSGEHAFAFYSDSQDEAQANTGENENSKKGPKLFYDTKKDNILDVWRLPSNAEILELPVDEDKYRSMNVLSQQAPTLEELEESANTTEVLAKYRPTFNLTTDSEATIKNKGRLVHFKEAYPYSSLAFKFLRYWRSASDIFDLEFFINKLQSTAFVVCTVEKSILSGLPFWDAANEFADDNQSDTSEDDGTDPDQNKFPDHGHRPLENVLANQIAEKMAQERREKAKLIQDLEAVYERFKTFETIITQQEMTVNIHRAANFLQDTHKITFLCLLVTLYQSLDQFLKEGKAQKEIDYLCDLMRSLTHMEDIKVTMQNGFHVNRSVTATDRLDLEGTVMSPEYSQFFRATQPIIDEEALNPQEFNLIQSTLDMEHGERGIFSRPSNFMGSMRGVGSFGRVYQCLDFSLINLHKDIRKYAQSNLIALEGTLKAYVRQKNKHMEEAECLDSPLVYSQMMDDKQSFLRMLIRQRQLKRILIMLMNKRTVPQNALEFNRLSKEYHEYINWKLIHNSQSSKKKKYGEQKATENVYGPGGSLKISQDQASRRMFSEANLEVDQVQHEIQKYMVSSALFLIKRETAALIKAFEMSNIKMQALIHPVQQFASTFDIKLDNRNHLDIINKVPAIQKMYTQIQNRSLEIQTLTSGVGVVITRKDLNESLDECCRSLVQFSEIEMRTRCEHLSMYISTLKQQLYVRDRQNEQLTNKLILAARQIDKIVTSRMFSTCKNLVYELDQAQRQLRFMKDSIFTMESKLTEKIHLCYDKELETMRANLAQLKVQFFNYQDGVSANVKALVRNEVNNAEKKLIQTAKKFQDLDNKTKMQIEKEKFDDYQRRMSLKPKQNPVILASQLTSSKKRLKEIPEQSAHSQSQDSFMNNVLIKKQRNELESLKEHEKEAREEVIRLQELIRSQRMFFKMRFVIIHEKHLKDIDHLKKQLTENQMLWDKLSEGENREKILKQEIERTHLQIANQDKIIDKLKEELKKGQKENYKLAQYKQSQSKRLGDLEEKARDLEILQGLDIQKIIGLLSKQDKVIENLKHEESRLTDRVGYLETVKDQDKKQIKRLANEETKYKNQALQKLEMLKSEFTNPQSFQLSADGDASLQEGKSDVYWQRQTQLLFTLCQRLQEENQELEKENNRLKASEVYATAPAQRAAATPSSQPFKISNSVDRLQTKNLKPQKDESYQSSMMYKPTRMASNQSELKVGSNFHDSGNFMNFNQTSQRFRGLEAGSFDLKNQINGNKLTSSKITINSKQAHPLSGQTMYQTLNMYPSSQSVFFRGPTSSTMLSSAHKMANQQLPDISGAKRSRTRERAIPLYRNQAQQPLSKIGAKQLKLLQQEQYAHDSICSSQTIDGPKVMSQQRKAVGGLSGAGAKLSQKQQVHVKMAGPNLFSTLQKNSLFSANLDGSGIQTDQDAANLDLTHDQMREHDDQSGTDQTQTGNFEVDAPRQDMAE